MNAHDAPATDATVAAADTGHAAVDVLGSRALWDLVTSFMNGFPLTVSTFLHECTSGDMASVMESLAEKSRSNAKLHGLDTGKGLLPHLAIAANDLPMLRLLLRLSERPQYHRDRKLSFARAHHCAVAFNRVEILTFINKLRGPDGSPLCVKWEPSLMRLALERDDPDLRVLDLLSLQIPQGTLELLEKHLLRHTVRGDFEVVRWLHKHGCEIYQSTVDAAADACDLDLLQYFYEHSDKRCMFMTAAKAAKRGDLEIVKLIVENSTRSSIYPRTATAAAEHGQLEIIKYFVESNRPLRQLEMINSAAWSGHLHVVQYLLENDADVSTAAALNRAAANGHLEIIKFLQENRTDGCAREAINFAAMGRQVEVVKFLYLTDPQGCRASLASALRYGAGSFEIVEFLCEQQQEFEGNAITNALIRAVHYGDLRTIALLHGKLRADETTYPALQEAVKQRKPEIVKFLCENQKLDQQQMRLMMQAVAEASEEIVRAVGQHASLEELMQAHGLAFKLSLLRIADMLAEYIDTMTTSTPF